MNQDSSIIFSLEEKLIRYLEQTQDEILHVWQDSIIIHEDDMFKDSIKENGFHMFHLVIKSLLGETCESEMQKLAYKVANERVMTGSNIGEYVYNVNVGRSIVIKYVNKSGFSIEDLYPIVDRINTYFDRFCFHAVTRYTELKDNELKEKVLFINQSHKDRLTLLGQMSSSFVHEFRNPLTAVIGFMKLLKDENPSLKYMETIEHELEQLKFRITQFLHAARLETVDKPKENIKLADLFTEITSFLYPSIVDGDVDLQTSVDTDCDKIYAKKEEIKQVLVNIILNSIDAVKNNHHTNRKLFILCKSNVEHITFTISNNGPQIPKDMQCHIFEPFYTTKSLGTGIGLYVCKTIIEKHNGTIRCESDSQQTSFIINLPKE
ncbi:histidine kinase N-terminal domain-containing protein [Metabacillus litoralis]|uniref:histidine kinase N-terminal domain-containing protein n=1 Tax=Metabacillus litoralis TaxID=152268 RepID=UPI001CFE70AB|nr:histidine kinase N-terminal domain-containing protein [Metabacillus litoralis]